MLEAFANRINATDDTRNVVVETTLAERDKGMGQWPVLTRGARKHVWARLGSPQMLRILRGSNVRPSDNLSESMVNHKGFVTRRLTRHVWTRSRQRANCGHTSSASRWWLSRFRVVLLLKEQGMLFFLAAQKAWNSITALLLEAGSSKSGGWAFQWSSSQKCWHQQRSICQVSR